MRLVEEDVRPQINAWAVPFALAAGAALGGIFTALSYGWFTYRAQGAEYFWAYGFSNTFGILLIAGAFWLAGLVLLGGPAWLLLHGVTRRTVWVAATAGFVLPFVFVLLWMTGFLTGTSSLTTAIVEGTMTISEGRLTGAGWLRAVREAGLIGLQGAAAAWLVWRISYRRRAP